MYEAGADPRRPSGASARSSSVPSRLAGRSAGREVASGAGPPLRPKILKLTIIVKIPRKAL